MALPLLLRYSLNQVEDKMKLFLNVLLLLCVALVGNACAGSASASGGAGLLVWFFIGFIALFVVSQLIPSVILAVSVIRGIFSKPESDTHKQNS